jgi:formamidopyrimidine-DNA glycosylase
MPELPEVQTIVNDLSHKITGYIIVDFWSDWPKAIKNKSLAEFKKEIKNRKILGARRLGKNIFIDLSGGKTLYIHLKMTGHLLVKYELPSIKIEDKNYFNDKVNQYIHHIWKLKKGKGKISLEFSDVRKFAKIVLDDTGRISKLKEIKKLGIDVMDKKFTLKKFEEILAARKNRPIGTVLMEQELMSGIGNIYRSEILFESGVLPHKKINKLKTEEKKKLHRNIQKVLKKAIRLRGTSDSDYRDTAGAPGGFQKVMKVYRKTGKNCPKCGTMVKREILGQRSVFCCPKCQK